MGAETPSRSGVLHERAVIEPADTFLRLLDGLYYEGFAALDGLASEFHRFHRWGDSYIDASQALHETLLESMHVIEHPGDVHNAIAVILADLIDRQGRDSAGMVCPKVVASRFGASLASAVASLLERGRGTSGYSRVRDAVTANELVRFVSLFTPHRLRDAVDGHDLHPPLPALDHLRQRLGRLDRSVSTLIGVQHLMGTTASLFSALADERVTPEGVFLLGKPYSSSHAVVRSMQSTLRYFVHPGSTHYQGLREHHEEADEHIGSLLATALTRAAGIAGRILLIDDGGRAIRMLHKPPFDASVHRFVCVEQTRRGIRELQSVSLRCPVINVAESRVKLVHESPIIATSVCEEMLVRLKALASAGMPISPHAAVLGFGAIGSAVARALREHGYHIVVFDPEPSKAARAQADGHRVVPTLRDALSAAQVIVGCTGYTSVGLHDYRFLQDNSVLVSASSSDIEFAAWHIRSLARISAGSHHIVDVFNLVHHRLDDRLLYLGDTDHPCHFLHVAHLFGRRVFLLNGGFPINFTGTVDPIAPDRIQLTRALLYAAAVQASHTLEPGLWGVHEESQRLIEEYCVRA